MSPLTPELWLKSHVSQTEPGMWKCGYCDGIHHVPCFLEMMAPLPPTNSPRCDPEMSLQKTDCCHIQQSADFSKELHHLVESLVYKRWAELSLKQNTNAGWTSSLALISHMWTHKWLRVDFTCTWRPHADRRLAQGYCFEQIKRSSAHLLLAASRISLSLYTEVLSAGDKAKSRWFKIQGTEAAISMQQTYKQVSA